MASRTAADTGTDADTDGDGLPDDWERFWFGTLWATADENGDGDSLDALAECLAGTDPTRADTTDAGDAAALEVHTPTSLPAS
jgi:hypothetical protein